MDPVPRRGTSRDAGCVGARARSRENPRRLNPVVRVVLGPGTGGGGSQATSPVLGGRHGEGEFSMNHLTFTVYR